MPTEPTLREKSEEIVAEWPGLRVKATCKSSVLSVPIEIPADARVITEAVAQYANRPFVQEKTEASFVLDLTIDGVELPPIKVTDQQLRRIERTVAKVMPHGRGDLLGRVS